MAWSEVVERGLSIKPMRCVVRLGVEQKRRKVKDDPLVWGFKPMKGWRGHSLRWGRQQGSTFEGEDGVGWVDSWYLNPFLPLVFPFRLLFPTSKEP